MGLQVYTDYETETDIATLDYYIATSLYEYQQFW